MPSAKPVTSLAHKSLYDTSVYINAIRSRVYYEALLPHFSRSLPRPISVQLSPWS